MDKIFKDDTAQECTSEFDRKFEEHVSNGQVGNFIPIFRGDGNIENKGIQHV